MIVVLCTVSTIMCASLSTESLAASISEVQKKFGAATADKRIIDSSVRLSEPTDQKLNETDDTDDKSTPKDDDSSKTKGKNRNDKMLDFFRYFAQAAAPAPAPSYPMPYVPYYNPYYQQPYMSALYSPYYPGSIMDAAQNTEEYDEEYQDSTNDVEGDDDGSRANKRRPGTSKNSPIFYIRLPPTPYMYIPGMGYISQPPTIQPLTPQYPVNPFINLPITYLSNAKPTGVFPWNQQTPSNFGSPQFPSYLPARPQKPYRPKPQLASASPPAPLTTPQDSKITHLGSYLFNGRPESIYLMPPYHNPYATNPYATPYGLNPYQAATPYQAPSPYNPYSPIYAPPALPAYY